MEPKKRIRVVDDDAAVSSVAAQMIRALGHLAIVAWGIESALSVWNETGRAFDLAIVDYNLGDGLGVTLARRFKAEKPGMPVVIASGMLKQDVELPPEVEFMAKPFSIADLHAMLGAI